MATQAVSTVLVRPGDRDGGAVSDSELRCSGRAHKVGALVVDLWMRHSPGILVGIISKPQATRRRPCCSLGSRRGRRRPARPLPAPVLERVPQLATLVGRLNASLSYAIEEIEQSPMSISNPPSDEAAWQVAKWTMFLAKRAYHLWKWLTGQATTVTDVTDLLRQLREGASEEGEN